MVALWEPLSFQRTANFSHHFAQLDPAEMAEHGHRLTIFVSRIAALHFLKRKSNGHLRSGNYPRPLRGLVEEYRPNLRRQAASATAGKMPALQRNSLQQHARDIVMLGSVADEEIELGHEALEQFARLESFSRFDRAQQSRLAIFFLARVFGLH